MSEMSQVKPFLPERYEYILILLIFLLLSIVVTWPLILHFNDGLPGEHPGPLQLSWHISWDAKTRFSHPTQLFQANIYYPSRDVLTYSEHLFTLGVLGAPLYFISNNPVIAYNFLIFLGFILSGFGCYLLIKELTGSRWGGLAGGLFFAFCPYKISELVHVHIFFSAFLPFMMLYFYRYLKSGKIKHLFLMGFFFLIQSLSSWHYLIFCGLALFMLVLWVAAFSRNRKDWLKLAYVLAALLISLIIIIPFAIPYFRAYSRLPDFERSIDEAKQFSAIPGDYLRVLPESLIYGKAPFLLRQGMIGFQVALFPGLVVLALVLAGIFIRRREEDVSVAFDPSSFKIDRKSVV